MSEWLSVSISVLTQLLVIVVGVPCLQPIVAGMGYDDDDRNYAYS